MYARHNVKKWREGSEGADMMLRQATFFRKSSRVLVPISTSCLRRIWWGRWGEQGGGGGKLDTLSKPFILSTANASIDFTFICGASDSGCCCSTRRCNMKHAERSNFTQQNKENWKLVASYNLDLTSHGDIPSGHNDVYVTAQCGNAVEEEGLRLP